MPIYWGDYFRDTSHLTLEQHGAYLLLIAYYWTHGKLPENDETMARILHVTRKHLPSIWLAIAPFFGKDGRHKRIDAELEKHRVISEKRSMAGRKGGLISRGADNNDRFVRRNIVQAFAKQTGGIPQPPIDSSSLSASKSPLDLNGHTAPIPQPQPEGSLATAPVDGALAPPPTASAALTFSKSLEQIVREKGWVP